MFFVDHALYFKPVKCPFSQLSTPGMSNSLGSSIIICKHNPYSVFAFLKELNCASVVISRTHLGIYCQGLDMATHELPTKSEQLYSTLRRHEFGLICISSKSCLWSIVGLPGSCAYYLMFRSIGQGSKGRTTAIVFLVHLVKLLGRESRKLTVMMRREMANHSMT